jgi:hypothetical protein
MYSQNALNRLREALPATDLDAVWREHTAKRKRR